VGGFIAQNLVPWVRQVSGSARAPMLIPAACLLTFGVITLVLIRRSRDTGARGADSHGGQTAKGAA
jgi:hypothetical protein